MGTMARAVTAAVLGFGLVGVSAAQATPIAPTFSLTLGSGTETFTASTGAQTTDFLAQFNIPQFDPTLGTLTSLSVTFTGSMSALGSLTNSGASNATSVGISQFSTVTDNPPQTVLGSFGTQITDGSANGDSFLLFTSSATRTVNLGAVSSGATINNINLSGPFSTLTLSQTSGFDPNLIGTGSFAIVFSTGEFTNTGGSGGNLSSTVATQDDLGLSVTYNFIGEIPPIPEPASLTLMATGMIGVAAAIRRRRKGC